MSRVYPRGEEHWSWKDNPTSGALHYRLYRTLGPASEYECEDCEDDAFDWSRIHGRDGKSTQDYLPRCRRCHVAYDKPHQGSKNSKARITEQEVLEIKDLLAKKLFLHREIAEMFDITPMMVSQIHTGKTWGWLTKNR